jgi:tetratricopeptide (TPR) repeat protein
MDAVTYPVDKVARFISENMVPLRVAYDAQPHAADFNIKWTPTLITLDSDGGEHHRTLGFLSPEELIPSLILGMGKVEYDNGGFEEAVEKFDSLLADYPKSDSTAEALYLRGVSLFKKTHEPRHLKEAYERLKEEYPSSEWAKRAQPYNLL